MEQAYQEPQELSMLAIADFKGYVFNIPSQQRCYRWRESEITKLIEDLLSFKSSNKPCYCMQPLAVKKLSENKYRVLDGQQRLTTFYLINKVLGNEEIYSFEYDRDNGKNESNTRMNFLRSDITESDENIDLYYMSRAYKTLCEILKEDQKLILKELLSVKACENKPSPQFIWYEIGSEDEHDVFSNLNNGKIPLTNSELIKAYLLSNISPVKEFSAEIAEQFREMELMLRNDRFWYMMRSSEDIYGACRMDFLFSISEDITDTKYEQDDKLAFENYIRADKNSVIEKWQNLRKNYQRLVEFYRNPYDYHYLGFLTSFALSKKSISDRLKDSFNNAKSEFIRSLREDIKDIIKENNHKKIEDYSYGDGNNSLKKLFSLHNIETILQHYESVKDVFESEDALYNRIPIFEQFPFDLLNKQRWNIEHIASRTDNDLNDEKDIKTWIDCLKSDFPDFVKNKSDLFNVYDDKCKENPSDAFNELRLEVEKYINELVTLSDKDNRLLNEDDKNGLGNLVLLDEHTNKSFHNALYARKRRIVIGADGQKTTEKDVKRTYVPICTKQVFMKYYNQENRILSFAWTLKDSKSYECDLREKLSFYFD